MPYSLSDLAQLIQLSVAPVFLLTGIAGMLSVMTQRLARVIDRTRYLVATAQGRVRVSVANIGAAAPAAIGDRVGLGWPDEAAVALPP